MTGYAPPKPELTVTDDGYLEVETVETTPGVIGLHVRRSPVLRDSDPQYAPVRQFIIDHDPVEISRETYADPNFTFGECEHIVYWVITSEYTPKED
ncbi:hypothetical protein [Prescottella equi]